MAHPNSSPLVGEEGARAAQRRGKVRGNEDGLTKRQLLPPHAVVRSRELRRRMGEPERRVWRALREAFPDIRFRRQVPFGRNPYHADFCCHAAHLIVEIDDALHDGNRRYDADRTRFLNDEGYRVLRSWNNEVMETIDGVVRVIGDALSAHAKKGGTA